MRKAFRGHFWGKLWRSKLLSPFRTMQVQTGKCYRETMHLSDSIVHVLQIYSYLVVHSDISTTRVVLHSLHRRLGFYTMFKKSCQCIFAALCFLQINPRVCCYQIELVRLSWVVIKCFFFSQVNKLHCFFVCLFCFCFFCCFSFFKSQKTWRYSWEKQEVQLVSFCFYQPICNNFFFLFLCLSLMVKSVHNIHIQNHFGQVCTP